VLDGAPERVELVEATVQAPGPGATLLRVEMAGVCGTDVHFWTGLTPYPAPMVLGHEGVGIVEELGEGVVADHAGVPVRTGDRVVWVPERACGRCHGCVVRGDSSMCEQLEVYCSPGGDNWAAWADFALLPPGMPFFRVAEGTPPEAVAAFGCALPTMLQAFERAGGLRPGQDVIVQGSGPVGLAATLLARLSGAASVVVIGAPRHRLEAARALGADAVVDIDVTTDPGRRGELAREATLGRGADLVIEATGVLAAVSEGLALTAKGGRYLVVGLWGTPGSVAISPMDLNNANQSIVGSSFCQPRHHLQAVRMAERHHASTPLAEMVSDKFALADAARALDASRRQETLKAVIVPGGEPWS
jgi:5-exo-hydroxycamphor dehydrogenase